MASSFELPKLPPTAMSPQMMVGAASPLWVYFGAAAAGGLAYWWTMRWTRPVDLGAFFDAATKASPLGFVVAAEEWAETAAEAAVEAAEAPLAAVSGPVGGEAAPVSPLAATAEAAREPDAASDASDHTMAREDIAGGAIKAAVAAATDEPAAEAQPDSIVPAKKAAPGKTKA